MVLWVTTIILPSFLEINCPAKPHSYRPVCSEGSTEISENSSRGIFLSSTDRDCPVQHRALGRPGHPYDFSWCESLAEGQQAARPPGGRWGSAWQLAHRDSADIYPPTCVWERSASFWHFPLALDSPKTPHCCVPVAPVQPPNVVSCTWLSNHKSWKYFISSCRIISL